MRPTRPFLLGLVVAAGVSAQTSSKPAPTPDLSAIDKSVSPCDNFYQYACGIWRKNNKIPADQSVWSRFNELDERNRVVLRDVLETAGKPGGAKNAVDKQIGDFYAACMDESAVQAAGLKPIQPSLNLIAGLKGHQDYTDAIAKLHAEGVPELFNFGSEQDAKDSTQVIAGVDQGGLGLPDRDYYLKDDPKSVEIRQKYLAHVQKIFELAGDSAEVAAKKARQVMEVETKLAKGSLDRVARRDPANIYHKMPVDQFVKEAPAFDWKRYFAERGAPPINSLNVAVPEFFKTLNTVLTSTPVDEMKAYLTWHVLHDAAPLLTSPFVYENFNFYSRTLTGAKELQPRWKRCVRLTDAALGEALGKAFVEKTFGSAGKERTLEMVKAIEAAMQKDVNQLEWMTPKTKQMALEKLHAIANKIGYPDKYRDYTSVKVARNDLIGNAERAEQFEQKRQLAKIGKPVDKTEWDMTPPTVNAYYDPQMNNINFPAGILQPPFYDNSTDMAVNFGAIGAVIGHELTHGFDDQGRQYDGAGNLRDWWTPQDAKEFTTRADCIVQEYGGFSPVSDVKLNGKLTLGENAADNGGVRLAYMALMDSLTNKDKKPIDGYTPEQRFFLGYAQVWCQNATEEASRMRAQIDPHSPGEFRVNGVVRNLPEFGKAFGCKVGQPMMPEKTCRVW